MSGDKKTIVVPILMIVIGVGWLLTTHDMLPGVNWVWILGLAAVGILVMAVGGIDKVTAVIGPFLIIATNDIFLIASDGSYRH